MNIDGELEDSEGVISASTSYAKATTIVEFDEAVVSKEQLKEIIQNLEYSVIEVE